MSPILEGVPLAEITTGTVSDFVAARRDDDLRLKEALLIDFSDVHPSGTHATPRRGVAWRGVEGNKKSRPEDATINLGRASNLIKADRKAGRGFVELATDSAVVSTRYGQWRGQRWLSGREAVEMRSFRIQDLRHAFAIASLIDDPKRIYEPQEHMGHSSIKTPETYVRFVDREGLSRSQKRRREMFGSLPAESEISAAAE